MNRKRYIAFSGGVESSTMCLLYARLETVERKLKAIHGEQFSIIRINPKNVDNTGTDSLPDYIRLRKFYPASHARFCARLFKIKPMDDFLAQQGGCTVFIGLNYDERDDREGNYGECKNVSYEYPLVEDRITREMCIEKLKEHDLEPAFPAYMNRGGCKGCFFKSKKEYEAMALVAPDEAYEIAELEESIQDKHPGIPNMRKFIDDARAGTLFDADEMYQAKTTGRSCGVFCHR